MVYAFVVSTEDDDVFFELEFVCLVLCESFSVRCCENYLVVVPLLCQVSDSPVYRFDLQHHSCTEAEGVVIHFSMFVECIVAQVMYVYLHESFVFSPLYDRVVEW